MANHTAKEYLREHRIKPLGREPLSKIPVSVRLPKDLDEIVRSQPNRNQWIIEAILDKAAKEIA